MSPIQKRLFVKNGIILSSSSLLIRTIGLFAGIYLADKIGTEGLGLYRLIISVYFFFASAVSSGFSLTVTRLVTDLSSDGKPAQARYATERCMALSVLCGVVLAISMSFSAPFISTALIDDQRSMIPLLILAPSLPFLSLSACIRGYFYAQRKTVPCSGEQLLEQIVEIAVFLFIFETFRPNTLTGACCTAVTGTTVAEIISFVYAIILYKIDINKSTVGSEKIARLYRKMLPLALPVGANSMLRSGLAAVENILIPFGLIRSGHDTSTALSQYGVISGMTLPVLTFPAVFILPFAMLIIPEIAEAAAQHHQKSIRSMTEKMLSLTMKYSIPVMIVFLFFATPICQLLYQNQDAGTFLILLAPVVPLMYLDSVVDGILKGLNEQTSYFVFNLIDSILRVILTFVLLPLYGIMGMVAVIIISELLNTTMSLWRLLSVTQIKIHPWQILIQPTLAILVPCLFARLLPLNGVIWDMVKIAACLLFYVLITVSLEEKRKPQKRSA